MAFSCILYAQDKGIIGGQVFDAERNILEKATISVLNQLDSSVISYTLTDDKGKFKLYKLPLHKEIVLIVSYIGTSSFNKVLELTSEEEYDLGIITLETNVLDEVLITSQPPVSFNKDTLEYNANYFKTRPDASVEELMKKLPGLQVNMDGTIYYQGKEVSKVLVNNKEFFAQDLRIATRNLDASMVDVVQVYRDKGDSKQVIEDESTLPVTINLKFKKQLARADFGKFYGSGGSRDRYEGGILLNTFRDTLQVSFIGFGNNINRQSFDYSELSQHAGLGRAENYGFQNFGGRSYNGLQNDISGGVNVNYDWGNITKLSFMYQYTYGDIFNENSGEQETFYDSDTHKSQSAGGSNQKQYRNSLSGRFNHRFDTTAFLNYTPSFTFNKSRRENSSSSSTNNLIEAINEISNKSNGNNQDLSYRHGLTVEKAFSRKVVLSLNNNLNVNNRDGENLNNQLSTIYIESIDPKIRLMQSNDETADFNNNMTANLQVRFHDKFNMDFFANHSYLNYKRNEEFGLAINGGDMENRKDSENDLHFTTRDHVLGTRLSWTILKDFSIQASLKSNYKHSTFDYLNTLPTRQNKNLYWLPSFNLRYKSLTVNYTRDVSHVDMYNIRSVNNTINEMSVSKAFPYAEDMLSDKIDVNMYKSFKNYRNQLNIYSYYSSTNYSIGYINNQNLTTGRYESELYIAPGTYNINLGANFSHQYKVGEKWNLRISQNMYGYSSENHQIQNGVENKSTYLSANSNNEFTFSWNDMIAISPKYGLNVVKNFTSAIDPNFRNSTTTSNSFTAGFNVMNVKGFTLETSYAYTSRSGGGFAKNPSMNIVNMSLYYDMKVKGQIKLSVFDLLNQNISFYNGAFGNMNYFNESITLRQYFLLGYVYKFNKAKLK
jgi:hypothetical protein